GDGAGTEGGAGDRQDKGKLLRRSSVGDGEELPISGHLEIATQRAEPLHSGAHPGGGDLLQLPGGEKLELLLDGSRRHVVPRLLRRVLANVDDATVVGCLLDVAADRDLVVYVGGEHLLIRSLEEKEELALVAAHHLKVRKPFADEEAALQASLSGYAPPLAGGQELLHFTLVQRIGRGRELGGARLRLARRDRGKFRKIDLSRRPRLALPWRGRPCGAGPRRGVRPPRAAARRP